MSGEEGGGSVRVGYRFHPNDGEIVNYFLKHKIDGSDSSVDNDVREIDLCQYDPSELPRHAAQGIDDDEWYFFCARPRDYFAVNEVRRRQKKLVCRKTKNGSWKLDGEARRIKVKGVEVGTKRTLVFQMSRGSVVERTKWIIHEYKPKTLLPHQRPFVLCKLMRQEEKKKLNKNKKNDIESKDPSSCDKAESSHPMPFDLQNPPVEVPIPEVDSNVLPISVNAANELDFSYPSTFQPEIHATQDTTLETNDFEEDPIKLADSYLVYPDEFSYLCVQLENMGDSDTEIEGTNGDFHDSVITLDHRKLSCINCIERNDMAHKRSKLSDTMAECKARGVIWDKTPPEEEEEILAYYQYLGYNAEEEGGAEELSISSELKDEPCYANSQTGYALQEELEEMEYPQLSKHAAVGQSQKESTYSLSEEDLRIAFTKLKLVRKCIH